VNKFCNRFYESRLNPNLKSKIENLKSLGLLVIACVFVAAGAVALAQQPTKVPRIGYLIGPSPSSFTARTEAFLQGLSDLGYAKQIGLTTPPNVLA
jgi:hypothetical protein